MLHINFFAVAPFVVGMLMFFLGLFVWLQNRSALVTRRFVLLCAGLSCWAICYSFVYSAPTADVAVFWARFAFLCDLCPSTPLRALSLSKRRLRSNPCNPSDPQSKGLGLAVGTKARGTKPET